jgi:hypothetical protein
VVGGVNSLRPARAAKKTSSMAVMRETVRKTALPDFVNLLARLVPPER